MSATSPSRPSRSLIRADRARLRAQGLRPITLWVPDVDSSAFRDEAHRQSLAAALAPEAADDQSFIDAISEHAVE